MGPLSAAWTRACRDGEERWQCMGGVWGLAGVLIGGVRALQYVLEV